MSADLFAEFADPNPGQQQPAAQATPAAQPAQNFSFFDDFNTAPAPPTQKQAAPPQQQFQSFDNSTFQTPANDESDDWGDFESGPSTVQPIQLSNQDPFAFTSTSSTRPVKTSQDFSTATHDPFAFHLNQSSQQDQSSWQKAPIIKAKKPADSSVLFDAEDDFDDDDDFGEFEGTETKSTAPEPGLVHSSSALEDLLGDMSVSQPEPPAPRQSQSEAPTRQTRTMPGKKSPVGGFGTMAKPKQPAAPPKPAANPDDDSWDTFDDWEASIPTKVPAKATSQSQTAIPTAIATSPTGPAPILSSTTDEALPGELPPTNVPPPGVLLSLFPSLFADAQDKLFKPMAAQTLPMRNKLMAEPATIAYLQGYLVLGNVAAHIIAGRKLRWKRDQHLSQGMRIGPASSRATSGMKLTGIDKGENLKEEREVSDVVRVWKEQVGRLRHVVSGANQIKASTLGHVPDLQDTMPVKTLKQSEGGIPARQPCMMCGLKREERVTAEDMATDDSFGEWWIDQVNMHRGELCYRQVFKTQADVKIRLPQLLAPTQRHAPTALKYNVSPAQHVVSASATSILPSANSTQRGTESDTTLWQGACANLHQSTRTSRVFARI